MINELKTFCCTLILSLTTSLALAADRDSGDFDYFVLALSWSPNWCELEGDRRNSEQCEERHDFGFVLHGLWPQYETGWPSNCRSKFRDPPRSVTNDMVDIMGSSGSAWHQWKKHGRCSGMSANDYFGLARQAFNAFEKPDVLRQIESPIKVAPNVVEAAILEVNPKLWKDAVTITCKSGMIQEARICLTKDLEFRTCGRDVIRDCRASSGVLHPIR